MAMASSLSLYSTVLVLLCFLFLQADARVPANQAFTRVNEGELGEYIVEYGASYRTVGVASRPRGNFELVFFNTTPNAFALGIRMAYYSTAETMRFVWSANRHDLVGDNATLKFGTDGNLVLSDADGRLVWSTNTSNKGVVGIQLLNNGNLVLYDSRNRSVWQSFDSPTDSLLVGQSLSIDGVKKLVSRVSDKDGSDGPYSLVMEAGGLALYTSFPNPLPYWTLSYYDSDRKDLFAITHACQRPVGKITFLSDPEAGNGFAQEIEMRLANFSAPAKVIAPELCKLTSNETTTALYGFNTPRFSTRLSFVRLDSDGNLRMYTYSPELDRDYNTWVITYQRYGCGFADACGLPRKCGKFGLCQEEGQCVACPEADGLKAWSNKCSPPALPKCNNLTSSGGVDFYKIVGAEHYSNKYIAGKGSLTIGLEECRKRCLSDCSCAAFFYWKESSTCFLTRSLDTLQQLGNPKHLAFIKTVKKA
eukprot:Gb_07970 [translate_table: standard]